MRRPHLLCAFVGLSTVACGAGWHQPAQLTPGPWPPRQQFQVWARGQVVRWHAVVVRSDSISGVPFLQAPACDTCRRAIPRASVDSVLVGRPMAGFWKTVGLVVGLPALVFAALCGIDWSGCFPET
jgi:hypothetical protein